MNNELVNEIAEWREQQLFVTPNSVIDNAVLKALDVLAPGSRNGLQGLSAADDGVNRTVAQTSAHPHSVAAASQSTGSSG